MTVLLAALCVCAGAMLQTVTGFGFSLLAAPLLGILLGPREAVCDLAIVGPLISLGELAAPSRAVRRGDLARLLAAALPGVAVGAVVLGSAPERLLLALVGLASLAGVAMLARGRRTSHASAGLAWPTGGVTGVLTTLTGTNGPPLVLFLLARGASPDEMRGTLAACFLALGVAGIAGLVLAGSWQPGGATWGLLAGVVAGLLAGHRLRERVGAEVHRSLALGVLTLSGLAALAHAAV